jgi:hypothetical protein
LRRESQSLCALILYLNVLRTHTRVRVVIRIFQVSPTRRRGARPRWLPAQSGRGLLLTEEVVVFVVELHDDHGVGWWSEAGDGAARPESISLSRPREKAREGWTGRAPREGRGSVGGAGRDGRSREILPAPAVSGGGGANGVAGACAARSNFGSLPMKFYVIRYVTQF